MRITSFKTLCLSVILAFNITIDAEASILNPDIFLSDISFDRNYNNYFTPYTVDTICFGDTIQLNTAISGLSYQWSPSNTIDYPFIANPKAIPTQTTTYQLEVQAITNNLIVNGDFSAGNTGFISNYTYNINLWGEATYYVGQNPFTYHPNFAPCTDHTTGTGNMMITNGAGIPNITIWKETVVVTPNTDYMFSCWLTSVTPSDPAKLQFFVNGNQIGQIFQATPINCNWNMFYNVWNSGTNTSAVISIVNQNTALSGNDYAIDDLYFAKYYTVYDSTTVVVLKPQLQISNDDTICSGNSTNLTISGANSYLWGNGLNTPTITVSPTTNTTYTVTATDIFGCDADTFVNVIMYENPQISFSLNPYPAQGCAPVNVTFTDESSPVMQSYLWNFGDGNTSSTQNPTHTYNTPGNFDVSLSVKTIDGCIDSLTLPSTVKVYSNPIASFTADHLQLPLSYANVSFNSNSSSPNITTWDWDFGDPSVADDISILQNPAYQYLNQGSFIVWLYVKTVNGCSDSTSLVIKVIEDSLVFPNIITPNGDGINDYLDIQNLENLEDNTLSIFNRWGKKVYEKQRYLPDTDRWNGSDLADGTYFYILKYKGILQQGEHKSSLTILR